MEGGGDYVRGGDDWVDYDERYNRFHDDGGYEGLEGELLS